MRRTTINLNNQLFETIKKLSHAEDKTLKQLIEEMIMLGLVMKNNRKKEEKSKFVWNTKKMDALVDIKDNELINKISDLEKYK